MEEVRLRALGLVDREAAERKRLLQSLSKRTVRQKGFEVS